MATGKVIQGRWIDVNKGSSEIPEYRSRYVGKEFNRGHAATSDLYAATPNFEALKLLVSTCGPEPGRETHLMLSDVKRAYFHAPATRELYIERPDEGPGKAQALVGELLELMMCRVILSRARWLWLRGSLSLSSSRRSVCTPE